MSGEQTVMARRGAAMTARRAKPAAGAEDLSAVIQATLEGVCSNG
ncbi:hypothetical protein [Roseospira visakhapatnamensis]|uniref:Uncharacterized protein n=1 Tax=Roseospira visakhapatnamensis TaxID=390880 RepID=A0A7W6RG65_9PROT|nr:hypothetical protein [Roseospira visakhapatnamensis]MBB4267971.1 hypothetical protein [Roseospira visakhapatnamensis]